MFRNYITIKHDFLKENTKLILKITNLPKFLMNFFGEKKIAKSKIFLTYKKFDVLRQNWRAPDKRFIGFEKQDFQIRDNTLHQGKDDIVGIQNVDISGCFAQFDASDDGGLGHGLGRSVGIQGFFDGIDELFLTVKIKQS